MRLALMASPPSSDCVRYHLLSSGSVSCVPLPSLNTLLHTVHPVPPGLFTRLDPFNTWGRGVTREGRGGGSERLELPFGTKGRGEDDLSPLLLAERCLVRLSRMAAESDGNPTEA